MREFNAWRRLSHLSSGLAYLHSQPARQVLPVDLSPHTVVQVYTSEEWKKAHLVDTKLLLLGAATKESLAQCEVRCYQIYFESFVNDDDYDSSAVSHLKRNAEMQLNIFTFRLPALPLMSSVWALW